MSFIGSLDQFDLSIILQKIEEYRKTGLLTVRQSETSVELSFQEGQLVCIGPVKPGITLGERFVRAGILSPTACSAVELALGERSSSEIDTANAFIDAHYVDQESLKRWALNEASQVVTAILAWEVGDLYFEAGQLPPTNRYLVPRSISSVVQSPMATPPAPPVNAAPDTPSPISAPINNTPAPAFISAASLLATNAGPAESERHTASLSPVLTTEAQTQPPQPQRITRPLAPVHIDPSSVQPDTKLAPADLSDFRESNQQVLFTPEQWRLFTCANGETTLSMAAEELQMLPEQVCRIAIELRALGLVTLISPAPTWFSQRASQPLETLSQWGNGGNGATFQLGSGWVVSPSQVPSQHDLRPEYNPSFAQVSF